MASEWYWTRGQDRFGPVSASEFVGNLKNGTVAATDLVWTDTMAEWKPAASVPAVAKFLKPAAGAPVMAPAFEPTPVTPEAATQPWTGPAHSVGYYNPAAGLPPRAAVALRGHAAPMGDLSDWPLDDQRVDQFREAFKQRQAILQSANLYKGLMALSAIVAAIMGVVALFAMAGGRNSMSREAPGLVISAVLLAGITTLYGFAWKATLKSKRWAPITITVLLSIGTAFSVISGLAAVGGSRHPGDAAAGLGIQLVVAVVIGGAFIVVSAKAIGAIPKYLASPAWCQELLSKSVK